MKVYHIAYEPTYKSVDIHFWIKCNLECKGCYTNFEKYDFGLADDPVEEIATKPPAEEPTSFLTLDETVNLLRGKEIKYAVFMGTEAALDPELPKLTKILHDEFKAYNIILTNGIKLCDMSNIDEAIVSIKAFSEDIHKEYTGKSNKKVFTNFKKMYDMGIKLQAETVVIPGLVGKEEVEKIAEFIASVDNNITLRVDAYFPVPGCPWSPAKNEEVEEVAEAARKHLKNVTCLTLDMKRIGEKAVRLF